VSSGTSEISRHSAGGKIESEDLLVEALMAVAASTATGRGSAEIMKHSTATALHKQTSIIILFIKPHDHPRLIGVGIGIGVEKAGGQLPIPTPTATPTPRDMLVLTFYEAINFGALKT
jgi:hypothetical protein